MDTSKLIIIAESLIAIIFMVIALFAWRSMGRNDRIAFLLIPLVATLAIFATGFPHLVLVVGYFTLIAAHIWEDAMTDMLNRYMTVVCGVLTGGLICGAFLISGPGNWNIEGIIMLFGSAVFLAFAGRILHLKWKSEQAPRYPSPAVTSS